MSSLDDIADSLQTGKAKDVAHFVQQAIDAGHPATEILKEGLMNGMRVVGELFQGNVYFIPEVVGAARAMNAGLEILKPFLLEQGIGSVGKVVLGTVKGDLHDIGKNLVRIMMEGKGLEVIDLGTDVPPEQFVQVAHSEGCQIIAMSALLSTTMVAMREVVEELRAAGIRDSVKVMIGGAPVSAEFCRRIGGDAYTPDASSAANAACELLKPSRSFSPLREE